MPGWAREELAAIGGADEMRVATVRGDGSLRKPLPVWVVRHGDDLYTRSVNGPDGAWFRAIRRRPEGHIRAGGVDAEVTFVDVDADVGIDDDLDQAYRCKYEDHWPTPVANITSPLARSTTMKMLPRT